MGQPLLHDAINYGEGARWPHTVMMFESGIVSQQRKSKKNNRLDATLWRGQQLIRRNLQPMGPVLKEVLRQLVPHEVASHVILPDQCWKRVDAAGEWWDARNSATTLTRREAG